MEKKRRKRITKRWPKVGQVDYSWNYWETSKDVFCPVSEAGQTMRSFVQCSTKMVYETFGKVSECSNNMRQHYRRDGKSKVGFDSLGKAKSACTRLWDKDEDMSPYKCSLCDKYHIGHKNGNGHSAPYKTYKIGDIAEILIDCAFAMKRLFAKDDNAYPPLPPYHVKSANG